MANTGDIVGGRWRVLEPLGRGGQATVYKVNDEGSRRSDPQLAIGLKDALRPAIAMVHHIETDHAIYGDLLRAVREVTTPPPERFAALKEMLPFEDGIAGHEKTAIARMKAELEALRAVNHPALLRVLEERIDERWFVTEYFERGSLERSLGLYRGQTLAALTAFLPIVEAVGAIHAAGIVHRDIKPGNVFMGGDGRLVLGDCGLAIKVDNEDRLTDTYENAGSRDWMPGWAMGMRLQEVRPTFDIFALGKLIWAMISGKAKMRLWYHDEPEFDLQALFPNSPDVVWVRRILEKTVVQHEKQCLQKIDDVRALVGQAIEALRHGGQLPGRIAKMRCRFCAIGVYSEQNLPEDAIYLSDPHLRKRLRCNYCGHIELFVFLNRGVPTAWSEEG